MLSRHDEVALRVLLDSLDRLPTVVSQEPVARLASRGRCGTAEHSGID